MPYTVKDIDAIPNSVNFRLVYTNAMGGTATKIVELTREQVKELLASMDKAQQHANQTLAVEQAKLAFATIMATASQPKEARSR